MNTKRRHPREWREQVPAVVFASLRPGEIRLIIFPRYGLADGGVPYNVPTENIPRELRVPNTELWVQLDDGMNVVRVWRRAE